MRVALDRKGKTRLVVTSASFFIFLEKYEPAAMILIKQFQKIKVPSQRRVTYEIQFGGAGVQ